MKCKNCEQGRMRITVIGKKIQRKWDSQKLKPKEYEDFKRKEYLRLARLPENTNKTILTCNKCPHATSDQQLIRPIIDDLKGTRIEVTE